MTQCRLQCVAFTLLILVAVFPAVAWGVHTVAGSLTGTDGEPLALSPIAVVNEQGRVLATGKTDDNGRYCVESGALAVGMPYRVCVAQANQPMEPCSRAVVTEADCATALGLLGGGAAGGALLGGLTTAELVGVGVGVAGATGLGIGLGLAETSGGGKEQPASRAR
ncbi:MAG: hypothetical protein ACE5I7_15080 [Candidatus Binatia bacterium]